MLLISLEENFSESRNQILLETKNILTMIC